MENGITIKRRIDIQLSNTNKGVEILPDLSMNADISCDIDELSTLIAEMSEDSLDDLVYEIVNKRGRGILNLLRDYLINHDQHGEPEVFERLFMWLSEGSSFHYVMLTESEYEKFQKFEREIKD